MMKLRIPQKDIPTCWQCLVVNEYRGEEARAEVEVVGGPIGDVCRDEPVLVRDKGATLFTSKGISFALSTAELRQEGNFALQSEIMDWIEFGKCEVGLAVESLIFPYLGFMDARKANIDTATAQLKKALTFIDAHLLHQTFLVGERLSLADIVLFCSLYDAMTLFMDKEWVKKFENFKRWAETIGAQEVFRRVIGQSFEWCAKQPAPLNDGERGNLKRKIARKVLVVAAEAKIVTAAAAAAESCGGGDPFGALAKGTSFVMDEFKRVYSNSDTLTVAVPHFWQHFDDKHYSIWHCVYKYPEELKLTFMTANLVSGMMQRLDKLRKNAFASMCIFGEDYKNQIAGVWVWRGQELAFKLSTDWTTDYESYEWKKLNPHNENDKNLINNFFTWDVEHEGMKFCEGKIFK